MTETQARNLAAACAECFEDDAEQTTVTADYYHPGRDWRIVLVTGNQKSVFHEIRTVEYIVNFHRSQL